MEMSAIKHPQLKAWIEEVAAMCKPDAIYVCDGTDAEYNKYVKDLIDCGLATKLNEKKRPNSILFRSDASDVARVENRTYIAWEKKEEAGPTNNWIDPKELRKIMKDLYAGCMQGRTMYVIPFSMGPIGSNIAKIGVELTDSPYVIINMNIMTRIGTKVLDVLGTNGEFVKCVHSVGKPLAKGEKDGGIWPCAPIEKKYISHFPETREILSYGSGYGGNALLGKKCLALRIASVQARDEGWLAEHMLILKLTNPAGAKKYVAAAFPSACGKTNLAMLIPSIKDWKVEVVGDDIAWMKFGKDGRLYAINPEAGFFGVAPGTSMDSNPNAMYAIEKDTIYTNVGLTTDGDVWWEGIGYDAPTELIDWNGNKWKQDKGNKEQKPAAHANARFTARAKNCPVIAPEWEDPNGVPIDAFLVGGRRPSTVPLVHQAFDWKHGVFMGSIIGSEITAAALDLKAGTVRRDPFAMLPFCGYNMGDYFKHWLEIGEKTSADKLPKIFYVNWFRKTADGKWLWPGYGDNSRVLAWIFDRCDNKGKAVETPIGFMPTPDAIDISGLKVTTDDMKQLLDVDKAGWLKELAEVRADHYSKFGDRLPKELMKQLEALEGRLKK